MTVYTVHVLKPEHAHNMGDWGIITPVNHRFVFPDELEKDGGLPGAFLTNMRHVAQRNFVPVDDYVVLSGDQLQIAAFCSILSHVHGWFNALKFDRREQAYFPALIRSYDLAQQAPPVLGSPSTSAGVTNGQISSEGRGSDKVPSIKQIDQEYNRLRLSSERFLRDELKR